MIPLSKKKGNKIKTSSYWYYIDFCSSVRDENKGYIYQKSAFFRHGLTLMNKNDKYVVISYPIAIAVAITIFLWILIDHIININNINWFTMLYGYIYTTANLSYVCTFYFREQLFKELSLSLDQWQNYKYLEKEKEVLKKNSEERMDKFEFYFYNCKNFL